MRREDLEGLAATPRDDEPTRLRTTGRLRDLRQLLALLGAHLEQMADGTWVAITVGQAAATDQAVLSARGALALRQALGEIPCALATGHARIDGGLPVGEVIDRAAALLQRARSRGGAVTLVDELTADLLGDRFALEPGPAGRELVAERPDADGARVLLGRPTPFVGRERELLTLEALYRECVDEPLARAVLVTAPAGTGKSRLRRELLRRLTAAPDGEAGATPEVLIGRGDPVAAGSPFSLLGAPLRYAAGLTGREPLAEQRDKLRRRFSSGTGANRELPVVEFLGELVGIPFPDEPCLPLRPARRDRILLGDQMRRAFVEWLLHETAARPLVLVLEDIHWGDLPSLGFVETALRQLADRPFFVLALGRPEVHERFPGLWLERGVQEIRLGGLSPRAAERLVREVLRGAGHPERVTPARLAHLLELSGGNALYLEELARAVAEGREESLPRTLLAMVAARLEALLPEARRVLRAASLFGDVFPEAGVRRLLGGDRPRAGDDAVPPGGDDPGPWLRILVEREVIVPRAEGGPGGERAYVFRHALLREAAYATLTDEDRTLGHRLAGEWLLAAGEPDALRLAGLRRQRLRRRAPPRRARPQLRPRRRGAGRDLASRGGDLHLARRLPAGGARRRAGARGAATANRRLVRGRCAAGRRQRSPRRPRAPAGAGRRVDAPRGDGAGAGGRVRLVTRLGAAHLRRPLRRERAAARAHGGGGPEPDGRGPGGAGAGARGTRLARVHRGGCGPLHRGDGGLRRLPRARRRPARAGGGALQPGRRLHGRRRPRTRRGALSLVPRRHREPLALGQPRGRRHEPRRGAHPARPPRRGARDARTGPRGRPPPARRPLRGLPAPLPRWPRSPRPTSPPAIWRPPGRPPPGRARSSAMPAPWRKARRSCA